MAAKRFRTPLWNTLHVNPDLNEIISAGSIDQSLPGKVIRRKSICYLNHRTLITITIILADPLRYLAAAMAPFQTHRHRRQLSFLLSSDPLETDQPPQRNHANANELIRLLRVRVEHEICRNDQRETVGHQYVIEYVHGSDFHSRQHGGRLAGREEMHLWEIQVGSRCTHWPWRYRVFRWLFAAPRSFLSVTTWPGSVRFARISTFCSFPCWDTSRYFPK